MKCVDTLLLSFVGQMAHFCAPYQSADHGCTDDRSYYTKTTKLFAFLAKNHVDQRYSLFIKFVVLIYK